MLDEDPHRDLIGQPHVALGARTPAPPRGQPVVGDLPAQHLDVLGHARRQQVAELRVGIEPLKLVVRAGHLQRAPGDLRRARQRRGGAGIDQPRPAPDQGDQEQLGHRVQVEGQDGALAIRLDRRRTVIPVAPVGLPLAGDRDRQRQIVVEHRAGPDQGRAAMQEPAPGRLAVVLQPGQPDPVSLALHVQRVGAADVDDPGARRHRGHDPGPPGQPAPGRDGQVNLRPAAEDDLVSLRDEHRVARGRTHLRAHRHEAPRRIWHVIGFLPACAAPCLAAHSSAVWSV